MGYREGHLNKLEVLKKEYNVDKIFSWSEIELFSQDLYSYFLKKIKNVKSDKTDNSPYLELGGLCHDLLEQYYKDEIKYQDLAIKFKNRWDELELMGLKFNENDEVMNAKIAIRYNNNIINYFKNFIPLSGKNQLELPLHANINGNIFLGYADCVNKKTDQNNNSMFHLIDFKTSTIYKGETVDEKAKQLILYAIAIHQMYKIPYEKIRVSWNFLKYVSVSIKQINGNWKISNIERCSLGEKLTSYIKKFMKKEGFAAEEIENVCDKLIISNNIDAIPKEIRDRFIIDDCYINININEEVEDKFFEEVSSLCDKIKNYVKDYKLNSNEDIFFQEINKNDEYYYYNLCDYTRKLHKPFNKYLKQKELEEKEKEEENYVDFTDDLVDLGSSPNNNEKLDDFFNNL